jgi:hypothetical protein
VNLRTSLQAFACATALAAAPSRGMAQFPDDPAIDRRRVAELLGREAPAPDSAKQPRPFALAPFRALLAWNSKLPYTLNDGSLWAGRGFNASVTGGVTWRTRAGALALEAVIAPTITWSENRPFFVFPYPAGDRSSFASPWHLGRESADLPLRFGESAFTTIDAGSSSLTVSAGPVAIGATTAPAWWGPALRNTLVLSSNAPGIPRAFVRTSRPLRTAIGGLEAELIAGTLTESRFFDRDAANDYRGVSGVRVALRPAFDSGLTLGVSRVVYGPVASAGGFAGHALDALTWWKPLALLSDSVPGGGSPQERDQVTSLFGRWVFPQAGSEVYAEWARQELPRSIREFLESPQHTQGYTIGLQSARKLTSRNSVVRVQAEVTDLRQNQVYLRRPPPDFYSGRATLQGWTQRGQLIGAGIGPGANSQWFATDWLAEDWQAGAFIGRIRWEDDALYRQPNVRFTRHDVSLLYGARGAWRGPGIDYGGSLTVQRRLNYLFQNETFNAGEKGGNPVDVSNVSLTFTLTPR